MKAYIIESNRNIPPFEKGVQKVYSPFVNFKNLLKEELYLSGLIVRDIKDVKEIDESGPFILIPDYLFVTAPLVKRFVLLSKNTPHKILRLSVIKSRMTDYYTALMDIDELEIENERRLMFDIFYIPSVRSIKAVDKISDLLDYLKKEATPIRVSQNFGIRLKRLSNVCGRPYFEEFPLSDEIIGHHRFWFHSLLMNLLYLNTFKRRIEEGEFSYGFFYEKKVVSKGGIKDSVIGRNVWIHPTAVIENSVIADNVRIGAKTIIKDSVIMRDCNIGDSNIIKSSLFGESVSSLSNSRFICSVIAPNSTVSNLGFNYSFLGEGSFLTTGVIFLYEGVDCTIRIRDGDELLDTGRYFLGSAAGEGSILGTRAIVNPGLAIPARTIIVLRPEEGVMRIPPVSISEHYIWDNASLRRFEEVYPDLDKYEFF